jgi:hypothetical protein
LQEQRDFILQVAQQYIPQPPDRSLLDRNSPNFDPITYAALKAEYDDRIGVINQLHTRPSPNRTRRRKSRSAKRKRRDPKKLERLLKAMPDLAKPEIQKKFWADAIETMANTDSRKRR